MLGIWRRQKQTQARTSAHLLVQILLPLSSILVEQFLLSTCTAIPEIWIDFPVCVTAGQERPVDEEEAVKTFSFHTVAFKGALHIPAVHVMFEDGSMDLPADIG